MPAPMTVKPHSVVDLTEWTDDLLMGWDVYERTRWEGEGGFIPRSMEVVLFYDGSIWWPQ